MVDEKLIGEKSLQPFHASVLIPVKNGGDLFSLVLDSVLSQKTPWDFEVIVIDSGSVDDSVEHARRRGVRVETVLPQNFGHGKTRNQLASLARGDFLVFITQDARPADDGWLLKLVDGCNSAPDVAGAFGPHRAHPGARLVTQRELKEHFAGFGNTVSRVRMEDRARFDREVGYRQFLHFFSNNNSCLRRSVWAEMPFPDVMFAEDQTWMLAAIKAGYSKVYVPDAAVYHSHDFGVWETLQRNFDEASSFQRDFGYEIQGSLLRALASAVLLAKRDMRWLHQAGVSGIAWIRHSIYMAAIELARTLGQFLGTQHRRLPNWLLGIISRDQALQRGRST